MNQDSPKLTDILIPKEDFNSANHVAMGPSISKTKEKFPYAQTFFVSVVVLVAAIKLFAWGIVWLTPYLGVR